MSGTVKPADLFQVITDRLVGFFALNEPVHPIAKGKRSMRRLTVGAAVLVVVGLVCAQAAAQEIPEEARKGLAGQLQGSFVVFRARRKRT